jgi:preprotein translocase subunit YajC
MIATLLLQAAQAAAPASNAPPASAAPGPLGGMAIPILMMVAVFYFLIMRPQQKKQREQTEWLKSLKKGDDVVTTGGVIGRISGLTDNTVTLEVQEKVRLKVLRTHIAGKPPAPGQPAPEPEKKS